MTFALTHKPLVVARSPYLYQHTVNTHACFPVRKNNS